MEERVTLTRRRRTAKSIEISPVPTVKYVDQQQRKINRASVWCSLPIFSFLAWLEMRRLRQPHRSHLRSSRASKGSTMREVTFFWKRAHCRPSWSTGPLTEVFQSIHFISYARRRIPKDIRCIIKGHFQAGKGPEDIKRVGNSWSCLEVLMEPEHGWRRHDYVWPESTTLLRT